jgi:hypothetical protein
MDVFAQLALLVSILFLAVTSEDVSNHRLMAVFRTVDLQRIDMTFVTVPRPWTTKASMDRTRMAICTWLAASPFTKVLLFASSTNVTSTGSFQLQLECTFGPNRIWFRPALPLHKMGFPLIRDWFTEGVKHAPRSRLLTFINSDILISDGWMDRVEQIFSVLQGSHRPVVVARRVNFKIPSIDVDFLCSVSDHDRGRWVRDLVAHSNYSFENMRGIDSWTFSGSPVPFNFQKIPDFLMGWYAWDNWVTEWLNVVAEVVSLMNDPPIFHMNHHRNPHRRNEYRFRHNARLYRASVYPRIALDQTQWTVERGFILRRKPPSAKLLLPGYSSAVFGG